MAIPFQPEQFTRFIDIGSGTELFYSFIIIICSLMVYFGTKQLYELSSHKGIKYFREAFMFFAIAYLVRYFIKTILITFSISKLHELSLVLLEPIGKITLFVFMYFSSMAVFYLLYSVMWKRWNGHKSYVYIFHTIAAIISLIVTILNNESILLLVNLIMFALISFAFYIAHKNSKQKKNSLYVVYMLLFVFWILNILDILIPSFLQNYQLLIYLASSGIFLAILYRVLKRAGN